MARPLAALRRLLSPAPLGRRGERLAARWLRRRGYHVVARNLAPGDEEADLVALTPDERMLVVVEVKTRASDAPRPEWSVGREKQRRLARLAARLLRERPDLARPVRFDVVAIVWPDGARPVVRHHEAAFESPW